MWIPTLWVKELNKTCVIVWSECLCHSQTCSTLCGFIITINMFGAILINRRHIKNTASDLYLSMGIFSASDLYLSILHTYPVFLSMPNLCLLPSHSPKLPWPGLHRWPFLTQPPQDIRTQQHIYPPLPPL